MQISGKGESGMESRKPGGSNAREAAGDKALYTLGSTRIQKVSGKKSLQNMEQSMHM